MFVLYKSYAWFSVFILGKYLSIHVHYMNPQIFTQNNPPPPLQQIYGVTINYFYLQYQENKM